MSCGKILLCSASLPATICFVVSRLSEMDQGEIHPSIHPNVLKAPPLKKAKGRTACARLFAVLQRRRTNLTTMASQPLLWCLRREHPRTTGIPAEDAWNPPAADAVRPRNTTTNERTEAELLFQGRVWCHLLCYITTSARRASIFFPRRANVCRPTESRWRAARRPAGRPAVQRVARRPGLPCPCSGRALACGVR